MAKILRVGTLSPLHTLDPREARELVSTLAVAQIFETPYHAPKGDGPATPILFTGGLERDSGGTASYSATISPGITFSDGTPLTAAIAAASLAKALREVQVRVEAHGDRVHFLLKAPNPRFELTLCVTSCAIALEKGGQLLGTGPYIASQGAMLASMRLVRNPKSRVKAAIDEVHFVVYPPDKDGRPDALISAIATGDVDFTGMLSRTDATAVTGVRKVFQPSSATAILYFNTERPALAAAARRRALAMAIDRMRITEISYTNALAFMATSLLPPTMGAARDEIPYDPVRAKALLAQAGDPGKLDLLVVWSPRPYLPNPQPVAELIARELKEIGVEVRIVTARNSDDWFKASARGDYDMILGGWIADTPDPADFLEANLRSDRVQSTGTGLSCVNKARFRSPDMDAALQRFREDPSAASRGAIMKLLGDEVPLLPLMYGPTVVVHTWKLKNVEISPLGVPYFATGELED